MSNFQPGDFQESLSEREIEILRLVKDGLSNHAIALKLTLTLGTVKWYNRQIFGKLGVTSRTQAVQKAIENKIIDAWPSASPPGKDIAWFSEPAKNNLPAPLLTFIGRAKELRDIRALLRSKITRLVTISGPGGIGKTRLALEVAWKAESGFLDGVWLVDLSVVSDPALIPGRVVEGLGLHSQGKHSPEEILVAYLRSRKLLLVLDNCEHLADASAHLIVLLLRSCPELHVLVTSREVLGVEGEVVYSLTPLPFPDSPGSYDLNALMRFEAVRLFVERVGLVRPGFLLTQKDAAAIVLICQRLDGIPLALELAAAWANMLSTEQIAVRLEDCFSILSGSLRTVLPYHLTMQAALDWSYNLLSEQEQVLLHRLSVFSGGCTLEAVEQVCSDEKVVDGKGALNQLVKKSMVIATMDEIAISGAENNPAPRYRLLEPVRQYARVKLERAGEVQLLLERHLNYFLSLADRAALKPFQKKCTSQKKLLLHEQENLRAALHWALDDDHGLWIEQGILLVSTLFDYWKHVGLHRDGFAWVNRALTLLKQNSPTYHTQRAIFLHIIGELEGLDTNYLEAKRHLEESVRLFRSYGNEWDLAQALSKLALWSYPVDQEGARQAIDESIAIARRIEDPFILALSLFCKGDMNSKLGNVDTAILAGKESLQILLDMGERGVACLSTALLAQCAIQQNDVAAALQYRQDYLRIRSESEDKSTDYYASGFLLHTSYQLGNFNEVKTIAQHLLDQSIGQNIGAKDYALRNLGVVWKCQGNYQRAAACYYESICGAKEQKDSFGMLACMSGLAGIAAHTNQIYRAARLYGAVEKWLKVSKRSLAWGPERGEYEKEVAALPEMLAAENLSRACAEGSAMTLDEAFQEACTIAQELSRL